MSKSIRLSDDLFGQAQKTGALYHRSPPQQVEYWAKLGRVMESTLSWPVLDKVVEWGQEKDISDLISEVESRAGRKKAKKVISATSGRA
jgi:ParD-like antitoxin of type II bacterial toxin-antitoxin system